MNPYASYLDGRPVLDLIRATTGALQSLTAVLTQMQMDKPPTPGKWSVCWAEEGAEKV